MSLLNRKDQNRQAQHDPDEQLSRNIHQGALSGADERRNLQEEHFNELIEAGIPEETAYHLRSLLSKDFVLSNLSSAEVKEMKWLARNLSLRVFAMHPPKESALTGDLRKFVFDDPTQALEPLSDQQRAEIRAFILGYISRVARAKDGWQQDEISKQYKVSETRHKEDKDEGGWFA